MGSTLLLLVDTLQREKSSYDKSPMSVLHATTSAPKLLRQPYFPAWPFNPTQNPYRAWNTELAYTLVKRVIYEFKDIDSYLKCVSTDSRDSIGPNSKTSTKSELPPYPDLGALKVESINQILNTLKSHITDVIVWIILLLIWIPNRVTGKILIAT